MAWRKSVRRALFGRYLLVTNTVASGLLDAVGDVLEQRLERVSPHDTPRTLRMGTVGLMLGPVDHFWYGFLDSRMPGRRSSIVAKKVAVDTLIFGPVAIVLFYMSMCKLEGRTWKRSLQETRDKFVTTFELDCLFWPAAQAINFYLVPATFRVLYLNMLYVVWSMVLSYLKHYDFKSEDFWTKKSIK